MHAIVFAAVFAALALSQNAASACDSPRVDVDGHGVWMRVAGSGPVTVLFESGNGADSSDWAAIEPAVRALGVRTVLYDRSGLGQSEPAPGPYTIDQDAAALERALSACAVDGPLIIVAHSYGGFIAELRAAADRNVVGLVLVDAAVPGYFTDAVSDGIVAEYSPQFSALEQARPQVARVLIPIVRAYPDTARRMRNVTVPATTPVIDIVAERTWVSTPEQVEAWRSAHAAFVAESPQREALFAADSGHNVMHDQPAIVIAAIARMLERTRPQLD